MAGYGTAIFKYLRGNLMDALARFSGEVFVERIPLDRQGYTKGGRYYGHLPQESLFSVDF
jgi:hypothetical protein